MAKTKAVTAAGPAKSKQAKRPGGAANESAKAGVVAVVQAAKPQTGRSRVVIENVTPQVECGRFAAKRVVGDDVVVEADVFGDGHDLVRARVLYRHEHEEAWTAVEMTALGNDHWQAAFPVARLGFYRFTIVGEIDHFGTWRYELKKRLDAGQDLDLPLKTGAAMIEATASRIANDGAGSDAQRLQTFARDLLSVGDGATATAFDTTLMELMQRYPDTT
ncbi:MAG: maltotransferase domain-containing protein, partial [Acidobacteriaceae bacterium]